MTNQDVIDQVWDWFVVKKQRRSVRPDTDPLFTRCFYRGPKGTKCAAGCLMPDEMYQEKFERLSIDTIVKENRDIADFFRGVDVALLRHLQIAHDEYCETSKKGFANHMRAQITKLATTHNLQVPAP